MKRAFLFLLVLLLAFPLTVFARGSSYIPDDCENDPCACFIQLGDEGNFVKGIVNLLKKQGYVDESANIGLFSEEIKQAVIRFQLDNSLPPSGTMDDDTLTLLIWGLTPEELDYYLPYDPSDHSTYPGMVYIPTDGGIRRHKSSTCCDMYDPRKVSIRNAEAMGFLSCGICHPD